MLGKITQFILDGGKGSTANPFLKGETPKGTDFARILQNELATTDGTNPTTNSKAAVLPDSNVTSSAMSRSDKTETKVTLHQRQVAETIEPETLFDGEIDDKARQTVPGSYEEFSSNFEGDFSPMNRSVPLPDWEDHDPPFATPPAADPSEKELETGKNSQNIERSKKIANPISQSPGSDVKQPPIAYSPNARVFSEPQPAAPQKPGIQVEFPKVTRLDSSGPFEFRKHEKFEESMEAIPRIIKQPKNGKPPSILQTVTDTAQVEYDARPESEFRLPTAAEQITGPKSKRLLPLPDSPEVRQVALAMTRLKQGEKLSSPNQETPVERPRTRNPVSASDEAELVAQVASDEIPAGQRSEYFNQEPPNQTSQGIEKSLQTFAAFEKARSAQLNEPVEQIDGKRPPVNAAFLSPVALEKIELPENRETASQIFNGVRKQTNSRLANENYRSDVTSGSIAERSTTPISTFTESTGENRKTSFVSQPVVPLIEQTQDGNDQLKHGLQLPVELVAIDEKLTVGLANNQLRNPISKSKEGQEPVDRRQLRGAVAKSLEVSRPAQVKLSISRPDTNTSTKAATSGISLTAPALGEAEASLSIPKTMSETTTRQGGFAQAAKIPQASDKAPSDLRVRVRGSQPFPMQASLGEPEQPSEDIREAKPQNAEFAKTKYAPTASRPERVYRIDAATKNSPEPLPSRTADSIPIATANSSSALTSEIPALAPDLMRRPSNAIQTSELATNNKKASVAQGGPRSTSVPSAARPNPHGKTTGKDQGVPHQFPVFAEPKEPRSPSSPDAIAPIGIKSSESPSAKSGFSNPHAIGLSVPVPTTNESMPEFTLTDPDTDPLATSLTELKTLSSVALTTNHSNAIGHHTASVIRQIVDVVAQSQDGSMELRLSPEELGRVRMMITTTEQGVMMHITAERPETLEMLRRHIDQLQRDLTAMGYQNPRFSFEQHKGGQDRETTEPNSTAETPGGAISSEQIPPSIVASSEGLDIRI